MELSIGTLPEELKEITTSEIRSLGVENPPALKTSREGVTTINLLNLHSLCLFLDHVAKIEGFKDSNQALKRTRFKNLPWWESSIWVPAQFEPRPGPTVGKSGFLSFLGSAQGLIADLEGVRELSEIELGSTPVGYDLMRKDLHAFHQSGLNLEDNTAALIQWVWRGLYDGAQLALHNSAPMVGYS